MSDFLKISLTFFIILFLLRKKVPIGYVMLIASAVAAGFLGVLLSPVHICLVLTREYFKADLWACIRG